jgi:Skp family chaperone for outer membrane proteins
MQQFRENQIEFEQEFKRRQAEIDKTRVEIDKMQAEIDNRQKEIDNRQAEIDKVHKRDRPTDAGRSTRQVADQLIRERKKRHRAFPTMHTVAVAYSAASLHAIAYPLSVCYGPLSGLARSAGSPELMFSDARCGSRKGGYGYDTNSSR